ncbi:uncharacterized protein CEXT_198861 [Caerostris extrusa]|uniref:Uncharacterized protein n=1 Tax=Caerostris extrusa TaxID=172846 RepID=A0AAV4WNV2_CAEEX|nr:uncharacterized protein CEXT_198861 [Caerostris extrusa]
MSHLACSWHSLAVPERFWIRHSLYDIFCDYINEMSKVVDLEEIKMFLGFLATLKNGVTESEMFQILQAISKQIESDCPLSLIYLQHHFAPICRITYRRGHRFTHYRCQIFRKLCKTYLGKEYLEAYSQKALEYIINEEGSNVMSNKNIKEYHQNQS